MKGKRRLLKSIITIMFLFALCFFTKGGSYLDIKAAEAEDGKYHIFVTNDIYSKEKPFTLDKKLEKDAIHVALINNSINTASLASITWTSTDETVLKVASGSSVSGVQSSINLEAAYPGTAQLRVTVEEFTGGLDASGNPAKIQYYAEATVIVPFRLDYVPVYNPDKKTGFKDVAAGYDGATIPTTEKNTNVIIVEDKETYNTVVSPIAIKLKNDIKASKDTIGWTSSNDSVANIEYVGDDEQASVVVSGAGATYITGTLLKDVTQTVTVPVLVRPSMNAYKYSGETRVGETGWARKGKTITGSSIYIETNTEKASNLTWRVYKIINGKEQKQECIEGTDYTITVSDTNNITIFRPLKQGTFRVYANAELGAFMDLAQWASPAKSSLDVTVPLALNEDYVVMNINDTYDLIANSNINDASDCTYVSENKKVATINNKGLISAKGVGITLITITDKETGKELPLTVRVIDSINLQPSLTLPVGESYLLKAEYTDSTAELKWESSDEAIAKVTPGEDGEATVTGVKAGTAIITASLTTNGVTKTVTCTVEIKDTVQSITINPKTKTIAISDIITLVATYNPTSVKEKNIKWVSSDEKIVSIQTYTDESVVIQGMAPGKAVISAINKDNIVIGSSTITVTQDVTSLKLSSTNLTMALGSNTIQLIATVLPTNATDVELTWDTTNKSVVTVNNNGVLTPVGAGQATIIVTSKSNPAMTARCNVTVTVPVTAITIDKTEYTMYVGDKQKVNYTVAPDNAANKILSWYSSNTGVATVDSNGNITAKKAGVAVIIVKTLDGKIFRTINVTVKTKLTAFKLDVANLTINKNEEYTFKPTITPADAQVDITWESSDPKVAVINGDGKLTAKTGGKCVIMVKADDGKYSTFCNVTVLEPVSALKIAPTNNTIYAGQSFKIKKTITPKTATNKKVKWVSSDKSVATVTAKGTVKGLKGGVTAITCTTEDGGYQAMCVVKVEEYVTDISLNYEDYTLPVGDTVKLVATVSSITATNKDVKWKSSKPSVAKVDSRGKVTALKEGTATITVTAKDGSKVNASCDIEVITEVSDISLSQTSLTMMEGTSKKINAMIIPNNATNRKLNWQSSDTSIAMVDTKGTITALKEGTATITVTSQDGSGAKALCIVYVTPKVPATGITLSAKSIVMITGETATINMSIVPANSTDKYSWSSDSPSIATVEKATGKVTALKPGVAVMTVLTESGKTANCEVRVVGLNKTSLQMEQYSQDTLYIEGITTGIVWESDNIEIATVSNTGVVTSKRIGTTYITANVNGRKLRCRVTVVRIG